MHVLIKWVLNALLFLVVANIVPGIEIQNFGIALVVAVLWGLISVTLRPILLVLTLPINILSLGLFTLVINGFLFWFLSRIVEGFSVSGFGAAFWGALLLSILHALTQWLVRKEDQ